MATQTPYPIRAIAGLAIALGLGIAVVATCNAARALARGSPLLPLWDDASLSQIAIASAPMVLLALLGIRARRPWLVSLCFTAAFWGFYAYVITRPYDGGGANIGLGILMLFSPLPIVGASLLSLLTLRKGHG